MAEDYSFQINPVVKAYINSRHLRNQEAHTKNEKERVKLEKERLDELKQQHLDELKHQETLGKYHLAAVAEEMRHKMQTGEMAIPDEGKAQGLPQSTPILQPSQVLPQEVTRNIQPGQEPTPQEAQGFVDYAHLDQPQGSPTGPTSFVSPTQIVEGPLGPMPVHGVQNPQDLIKRHFDSLRTEALIKAQGKGLEKGYESAAEEPFKAAGDVRKSLEALKLHEQDKASAAQIAHENNVTHLLIGQRNNATALEVAKIHAAAKAAGVSQEDTDAVDGYDEAVRYGTQASNQVPAKYRSAVAAQFKARGEIIPDYKKMSTALGSIGKIDPLLDLYRQTAREFSIDSPDNTAKGNQNFDLPLLGAVGRVKPGSSLDARTNTLKSMGGTLATFFDEQARKSDAEILRAVKGLFDPKLSMKDNLANIEIHFNEMKKAARQNFPPSDAQTADILIHHGLEPSQVGIGAKHVQDSTSLEEDAKRKHYNISQARKDGLSDDEIRQDLKNAK